MFAKKSTNMADDKRTAFHKTSLSTKINRSGHVSLAQTRRHSWFGNLLDFSDDKGYSRSDKNNNKKLSKNLLTALDLKTDRILEDQQNFKENDKATESGKSFYFAFMQNKLEPDKTSLNSGGELKSRNLSREKNKQETAKNLFDPKKNFNGLQNRHLSSSRLTRRRATVHYTSTGSPALMDHSRRTAHSSLRPNEIRALQLLKDVCRDYIVYKLHQHKLMNKVVIDREKSKESWLFSEIVFILRHLETMEKKCFSDIALQTGVKIKTEEVLRKTFFQLSNQIITTDIPHTHLNEVDKKQSSPQGVPHSNGRHLRSFPSQQTEITWGRLCAILSVAAGLAIDCVHHGHSTLVNYLIEYIGDFAREEEILEWIIDNGGWEALKDLNKKVVALPRVESQSTSYNKLTSTAIAFVFCSVGAILAAFAAGNLST